MIIGFDGSRAFLGERTGTENYSYQLLKALAKLDRKNQYVVYVRSNSVILSPKGEGSLTHVSPTFVGDSSLIAQNDKNSWPKNFQFKVIPWLRLWTQGGLAWQTFKDKLDVLFVPAHTLPVIRKPGLKTVITVHDLGSEYLPSMHQIKQRLYLGFMQKVQLQTATKIIAVSKATKKDLVEKAGIDPEKVSVVYEGHDKDKFKNQKSKIKISQTLKKYNLIDQNYFLFVGTVQPRKNLTKLIQSFNQFCHPEESSTKDLSRMRDTSNKLRDSSPRTVWYRAQNDKRETDNGELQLVIVGQKGWLSDEIYKLPKKLGIEGRVKFLGYVPEEDLPALYSGAIALTFPSLFEGFGLPILEAQACGCPVLTSNVSSMPEVAGKGAVYVDPYNIEDIVEGMQQINNQDTRNKLIKAGFENVKRFSWEKCAKETLEVLEKK